jgi:hypothetical protein
MRKESAEARVVCPVCADDTIDTVKGATEGHAVFGKLFVSIAMLEDVRPGLWAGVRELVGGNADYGAVLLVEFEQFKGKSAIDAEPESIQV